MPRRRELETIASSQMSPRGQPPFWIPCVSSLFGSNYVCISFLSLYFFSSGKFTKGTLPCIWVQLHCTLGLRWLLVCDDSSPFSFFPFLSFFSLFFSSGKFTKGTPSRQWNVNGITPLFGHIHGPADQIFGRPCGRNPIHIQPGTDY